ncbi:MAG: RNA-binding protein [Desulfurococcales archaeon]|nr:RNA-binding protein [Desulfurococcales archaeon]
MADTHTLLSESLEKTVYIRLKGGREVRGTLKSFDQHLNILLHDAEEIRSNGETRKLGIILIRGDNVVMISPAG